MKFDQEARRFRSLLHYFQSSKKGLFHSQLAIDNSKEHKKNKIHDLFILHMQKKVVPKASQEINPQATSMHAVHTSGNSIAIQATPTELCTICI